MKDRTFAQTRISFLLLLLSCATLLSACAFSDRDDLDNAKDEGKQEGKETNTRGVDGKGFWTDYNGIGPDWYIYGFSSGHTVYPRAEVYAVTTDGKPTTYIQIKSYYKNVETGFFTVLVANGTETPKEIVFSKSAKQYPDCISFDPIQEVDCSTNTYDVLFSSNRRPIIDFTLTPPNPTISIAPRKGRKIWMLPPRTLDKVERAGDAWKTKTGEDAPTELPSVYQDPSVSRISSVNDGYVVLTTQLRLIETQSLIYPTKKDYTGGWKMVAWKYDEAANAIEYICKQPPVVDYDAKEANFLSGLTTQTFSLGTLKTGSTYAITLCGGTVDKDTTTNNIEEITLPNGLWRITGVTPMHIAPTSDKDFFTTDTIYLRVATKKEFFLSPNVVAWPFGKERNVTTLTDPKLTSLKPSEGVMPFGI